MEVKQTPEGKWGLYLDGQLLGESKSRFDADFAKGVLERHIANNYVRLSPEVLRYANWVIENWGAGKQNAYKYNELLDVSDKVSDLYAKENKKD